jgi:hypothetical protein
MCTKVCFAPPELGLVRERGGYKHSAPPELNAMGRVLPQSGSVLNIFLR